jgi:phosphopantothenoylcysteine decarboxylase/phosphopantothenate--cysteine ligase
MSLAGRELVLGVTGSIAAYKAAHLLRELRRLGAGVTVVMTEHAREFVAPLTFRTLSGRPVLTDLFDPGEPAAVEHVALAERSDLVIVAPATANTLARVALGLADDFLGTLLLASRAPLLLVPAMDGEMWHHPTVQSHVATLRARGATVMEPGRGELASGLHGTGRLPEVEDIVEIALRVLWPTRDLTADHVLVTAGPTREPVDPVRYFSNRSSGRMGYALATLAARRGAQVTLVTGPTSLPPPLGVRVIPVQTAEEMRDAVRHALGPATIVIKAAAVADYRVPRPASGKIRAKQTGLALALTPTPDILAELGEAKGARFLVGFAAETEELRTGAEAKLRAKGIDLIVANDVSRADIGFDADANEVAMLDRWGGLVELPRGPKLEIADRILDRVQELRRAAASAPSAPAVRP